MQHPHKKKFAVITLFPEMFQALNFGIPQKAQKLGYTQTLFLNPRHYADNPHGFVDDRPYGGGAGMIMSAPPLSRCIHAAKKKLGSNCKVIYFSPHGTPLKQHHLATLQQEQNLIFVCGRYEGIDQRLIDSDIDVSYCLADCIFSGGEIPTMACIDGIIRLIPGVLNNPESAVTESFSTGLLDYPHYTRPTFFKNMRVPPVLLSGNHVKIRAWCEDQALKMTQKFRPDLLKALKSQGPEQRDSNTTRADEPEE